MYGSSEGQSEAIRTQFDGYITIDFQVKETASGRGFLSLREMGERLDILGLAGSQFEDNTFWVHSRHSHLKRSAEGR